MSPWTEVPDTRGDAISEVGTTAFAVYFRLLHHRNRTTGRTHPSIRTLEKSLGVDRKTILKAVRRLEEAGWISVTRDETENGKPVPNRYDFPPQSLVQKEDLSKAEGGNNPPTKGGNNPPSCNTKGEFLHLEGGNNPPTEGGISPTEPEEVRTRGKNQKREALPALIEAWNEIPGVSHCRAVTDSRKKAFRVSIELRRVAHRYAGRT